MAQKTDAQLTTEANIIRDETAIGANTALRIGIMLDNLIDSKTNNDIVSNAPITLGASTSIVPTQNAVKTYADGLVTGLLDDRGNFDASTGGSPYPTLNGSGTGSVIQKGDIYFVSVAGTVGTTAVSVGSSVRALVDTPAQTPENWDVLDAGVGYIAEPAANKSDATDLGGVAPSHTLFPTQYAVKSYVDDSFNPLIGWTTENVANKIQDLTIAPTSAVQYPSSAAVTTYAEPAAYKSNDAALGAGSPSTDKFPTQYAVKTYVDANISTPSLQDVVAINPVATSAFGCQNPTDANIYVTAGDSSSVSLEAVTGAGGYVFISNEGSGTSAIRATNLTAYRTHQLPDADGTLALQSYKVYSAIIQYAATPIVIVLENTLGDTVTWINQSFGASALTSLPVFTFEKTVITANPYRSSTNVFLYNNLGTRSSNNQIDLVSIVTANAGTGRDLNVPFFVEIRVYP